MRLLFVYRTPVALWHAISLHSDSPCHFSPNRDNRDQAIKSISKAAKLAKLGDCVAVAPEGTRSLTGQLLPFKKGPFYLWETLQNPVIPMVTIGAYDLCPPGSQVCDARYLLIHTLTLSSLRCQVPVRGTIHVKLLRPIYPSEAASRDDMSLLVRQRMLECIAHSPADTACELTWPQRLENLAYLLVFYSVTGAICTGLWLYVSLKQALLFIGFDSFWVAAIVVLSAAVVITLLVYFYIMYLTYWIEDLFDALCCCGNSDAPRSNKYSALTTVDEASGENRLIDSSHGRSQPPANYGSSGSSVL